MAARTKKKPADLFRGDPAKMAPDVLDQLVRECERKLSLMEAFAASEEWALTEKRLRARRDMLENEMRGLNKRLVRPLAGHPPVTLEQIAYQQGRIDENSDLLRFPKLTLALWRDQVAQLDTIRERTA